MRRWSPSGRGFRVLRRHDWQADLKPFIKSTSTWLGQFSSAPFCGIQQTSVGWMLDRDLTIFFSTSDCLWNRDVLSERLWVEGTDNTYLLHLCSHHRQSCVPVYLQGIHAKREDQKGWVIRQYTAYLLLLQTCAENELATFFVNFILVNVVSLGFGLLVGGN